MLLLAQNRAHKWLWNWDYLVIHILQNIIIISINIYIMLLMCQAQLLKLLSILDILTPLILQVALGGKD